MSGGGTKNMYHRGAAQVTSRPDHADRQPHANQPTGHTAPAASLIPVRDQVGRRQSGRPE
ncbi:hypothetical protein C1I95_29160 [Micromonospora craterilacus]|uniref:Uncharacterized protein n=1 Tax=Micromonospora craterilacus TaxID=1655439 RepID=A0A2W2DBH4_9ACTN|nr:hypothetical protein C1I95_29160 [Micromonospora craterilacus]